MDDQGSTPDSGMEFILFATASIPTVLLSSHIFSGYRGFFRWW